MSQAYPLAWPIGMPCTKVHVKSRMQTSVAGAVNNLTRQLRLFGKDTDREVQNVVVSSNVTLTDQRPTDSGVACYFVWEGLQCCIAVDRYFKVEENLQAIALVIEAERTKMRHGGLNIVRAGFRGYASLPPPVDAKGQLPPPWRKVLNVQDGAGLDHVRAAYLKLVKTSHPDRGGDAAKFNQVVDAWRQAQEELSA